MTRNGVFDPPNQGTRQLLHGCKYCLNSVAMDCGELFGWLKDTEEVRELSQSMMTLLCTIKWNGVLQAKRRTHSFFSFRRRQHGNKHTNEVSENTQLEAGIDLLDYFPARRARHSSSRVKRTNLCVLPLAPR